MAKSAAVIENMRILPLVTADFGRIHRALTIARLRGWALDGDLAIPHGHDAEQPSACDRAEHGADGHEGEEYQHAAVSLETRRVEDFDPRHAGADAERGPAERVRRYFL